MKSVQMLAIRFCFSLSFALLATLPVQAAGITGAWDGALDLGVLGETRVTLNANDDPATITSPDRHWSGVKTSLQAARGQIIVSADSIKANFRGQLSRNGETLSGQWTQDGRVRPLTLFKRAAGAGPTWPDVKPLTAAARTPTDTEIREMLRNRILRDHQGVGMVVGVIDSHGRRIVAFGRSDGSDPRPLDGETVFEVGSISKIFTSLLLEEAVSRGQVALNDPAARLAPHGVAIPERDGQKITLIELSTHTSGLPDDNDLWERDPVQPYRHYDVARFFDLVGQTKLSRSPGKEFEYSNIGASLLGQLLSLKEGKTYAQLIHDRITAPLGMRSTAVAPTPGTRAAIGHDAALKPVAPFMAQAFDPAGGIRSNADDMLTFLGAELGFVNTPLAQTLRAQWSSVRGPSINPRVRQSLGWAVTLRPEGEIIWHNGGTPGFRSFAGFNPKTGVGVVVLSNASTGNLGPEDIGLRVLDATEPLDVPAPARDK
jgi:CubicO group peptidase (beta-lactamase class C family)